MRHVLARSTLYCGFSVLGGAAGRTLTSDGGGVLLSVSSDGKALTIRWRAYEVTTCTLPFDTTDCRLFSR